MSLSCREQLVRLARDFDALIICDDVYDFLWWETDRPKTVASAPEATSGETLGVLKAVVPRLVDVDRVLDGGAEREGADGFGNVMSNGSFSKIVGPGVRTGWIEGESIRFLYVFDEALTSNHHNKITISSLIHLRTISVPPSRSSLSHPKPNPPLRNPKTSIRSIPSVSPPPNITTIPISNISPAAPPAPAAQPQTSPAHS
jgi:hypothetical protein